MTFEEQVYRNTVLESKQILDSFSPDEPHTILHTLKRANFL